MKKNNQFFSNLKTTNKMNIENNFVRDENIKNIASYAYVNLIIKTRILSTEELVFAIQTRIFHVRFKFRLLEIRKQYEKFKKMFRFVVEETKNIVSRKRLRKLLRKISISRNHR